MIPGGSRPTALALAVALALAACAGPFPYRPERQPFGAAISVGMSLRDDRLLVRIDSEGYRVERAVLVAEGDREVSPEALVPATEPPGGGLSIGVGVGGGTASRRGSYSVGTGVGLGSPYGEATTLAVFRLGEAGPPPWRLRVKVVGVEPVDIVIDPARAGTR
jgi:hypothetical protein